MKLIAALLISASAILGFTAPAMAGVVVVTPGETVCLPEAGTDGAINAATNVIAHTDAPPLDVIVGGC